MEGLTANETGGLSLPAMTIIGMALLMLPYLIRRYSGKSVTELLHFSALLDGIQALADKARGALFGKNAVKRRGIARRELDAMREADAQRAAENRAAEIDRTRKKQRAGNMRNDYLKALSDILTFARKQRLFAIVPGNISHNGQAAELAALLVTHARVVGILAYSFDGTILCRSDGAPWQVTDSEGTRDIGSLTREAAAQDALVRGALSARGMEDIPYETVLLFTGSSAVLTGERPPAACTGEELFQRLSSAKDLCGTALDPKELGKRLAALRAGKSK